MAKALKNGGVTPAHVDYINAHGTGTIANDRNETTAINDLFAERAAHIPVSSIKSMLGHCMGAASAIEAIACCLAIERGMIPPTINYRTPDPECNLDYVPNTARHAPVTVALNNGFAFGGNNCCVVFGKEGLRYS
jgi:3-oxoacyl-[acyl-carrier-protein] synthase II